MTRTTETGSELAAPGLGCIFVIGSPLLRHCPSKPRDPARHAHYSSDDSGEDDRPASLSSPRRNKRVGGGKKLPTSPSATLSPRRNERLRPKRMEQFDGKKPDSANAASPVTHHHRRDKPGGGVATVAVSDGGSSHRTAEDTKSAVSDVLPPAKSSSEARETVRRSSSSVDEGAGDFVPPDGGWGWVVCLTSLWVNGCVMGTVSSFGILYDFIVRQHREDTEASFKTSFIGSCLLGVMLFACCVSGLLCDVIGLRQTAFLGGVLCVVGFASSAFVTQLHYLFVTYGVILGCGFGLLYSPLVAISGHYFSRRLGLVNGIVTFGPSAFTMALSFALPAVLREFGLRNTLLGFSGFGLTIAMATLSWKPLVKAERSEEKDYDSLSGETRSARWKRYVLSKVYDRDLWSNRPFIVWCLAIAVGRFGYMEPNFHLVNHVSSLLPNHNASVLVTIMAGTSGIGKLVFGLVSDFLRNYRIALQQGALFVYGAILLLLPMCSDFAGFLAIAVSFGLADALIMVLYGPNVVDLVGPGRTSQAFGFMSLLSIPGFLSAPAITGRLHDELGHYDAGFYLAGGVSVLAAAIMIFITKSCSPHSAKADLEDVDAKHTGSLTPAQADSPGDYHAGRIAPDEPHYTLFSTSLDEAKFTEKDTASLGTTCVTSDDRVCSSARSCAPHCATSAAATQQHDMNTAHHRYAPLAASQRRPSSATQLIASRESGTHSTPRNLTAPPVSTVGTPQTCPTVRVTFITTSRDTNPSAPAYENASFSATKENALHGCSTLSASDLAVRYDVNSLKAHESASCSTTNVNAAEGCSTSASDLTSSTNSLKAKSSASLETAGKYAATLIAANSSASSAANSNSPHRPASSPTTDCQFEPALKKIFPASHDHVASLTVDAASRDPLKLDHESRASLSVCTTVHSTLNDVTPLDHDSRASLSVRTTAHSTLNDVTPLDHESRASVSVCTTAHSTLNDVTPLGHDSPRANLSVCTTAHSTLNDVTPLDHDSRANLSVCTTAHSTLNDVTALGHESRANSSVHAAMTNVQSFETTPIPIPASTRDSGESSVQGNTSREAATEGYTSHVDMPLTTTHITDPGTCETFSEDLIESNSRFSVDCNGQPEACEGNVGSDGSAVWKEIARYDRNETSDLKDVVSEDVKSVNCELKYCTRM